MIIGSLSTWQADRQLLPAAIQEALSFITQQDVASLTGGKYPIRDDDMFALVSTIMTEPAVCKHLEVHKKYIDIHIVLTGREKILVRPNPPTGMLLRDALQESDVALYADMPDASHIHLMPGEYAIIFPGEQHAPGCAIGSPAAVHKVVLKVSAALVFSDKQK